MDEADAVAEHLPERPMAVFGGGDVQVDICSSCHPFYTGKQKFVDTAGRVEKFQKKFGGDYFKKK